MRVLSIFGTRPEAVKMAPVVQGLKNAFGVEAYVCVTAQHREMLDQVLDLFQIKPDFDLDLMKPDQSLPNLTSAILIHLNPVLHEVNPDWVLVQGDTTTAMATTLLSYYHKIKIGHIEAGLRTQNKWAPFPEEINRRIVGTIADLHFAPTEWARKNLLKENVPEDLIHVTGNPVIDTLYYAVNIPYNIHQGPLTKIPNNKRICLVTAHRRENFGQPIRQICSALLQLAEDYAEDLQVVYPVHLNENIRQPVYSMLKDHPNITLLPPLEYLHFVNLMKMATMVLTDSGGLQEEAPALGKPVLVMREVTERPEGIQAGTVRLVGTQKDNIVREVHNLLDSHQAYTEMAQAVNPYGDGKAASRIVASVLEHSN